MKLIVKYWAKAGGLIAIGIISYLVFSYMKLNSIASLVWIHFALLLTHQFEEYVYPGGFKEYFNNHIANKTRILRASLTDSGIIIVNVILAWTAYGVSAINGYHLPLLIIGLLGVTILNGLMHTTIFIIKREYNPGLLSGLLLFIPFGIYFLIRMIKLAPPGSMIPGLMVFVIGAGLIPITIWITGKQEHHPPTPSQGGG